MKSSKVKVATGVTILGLGGLAGLALSAGPQASKPVAVKPLVRTKVIRRTIHVTKHAKPRHPVGAAPLGGHAAVASYGGGSSGEAGTTTGSSSVGSAPASSYEATPVTTSTSGGGGAVGGGGGEGEHEHEHESEGYDD